LIVLGNLLAQIVQSHNALTKRAKVRKCAKKCEFSNRTFFALLKRAIAHFQSVQLPNPARLGNCAVAHHTFSHFSKVQLCDRTFWRTFQKYDCAIALFVALFKSAIVRSHFFALFKSATNRSIALSKRANVRNKCEFLNRTFLHFKKSDRTFSMCAIA